MMKSDHILLQVKQIRYEADGVVSIQLVDPAGGLLPEWKPGAHIDLSIPCGVVRQYSLAGDPADRSMYRIGVLNERESRGGSRYIHEALRVGQMLEVTGLRNHFGFEPTPHVRFVAGGIGITPLLPMIDQAQDLGLDWCLTYGGRARNSMAFLDELRGNSERVRIQPEDEFGLIDLAQACGTPSPGTAIYACGPPPLLKALEDHCTDWPAGSLRVERFTAPVASADITPEENTGEIEVRAERSGVEIVVPPDESIMDCLEKAGVCPLFSCREGICGTCETKVLEGVPAHHDYVLTDEEKAEGNTMMICVSRAKSRRLVLDI